MIWVNSPQPLYINKSVNFINELKPVMKADVMIAKGAVHANTFWNVEKLLESQLVL